MTALTVNPRCREWLSAAGAFSAQNILDLHGEILCGHPDRNVATVTVGGVACYLKREHRISARVRLRNFLAGFGFASQSQREFRLMQSLMQRGILCAEPVATGHNDTGGAFLLIRAVPGAVDLRTCLENAGLPFVRRRAVAKQLGRAVAQMHNRGAVHFDLFPKHVLVANGKLIFLDWQRAQLRSSVPWRLRRRDLASLDASLSNALATRQDRLACLSAYLDECQDGAWRLPNVRQAVADVHHLSLRMRQKRRIREMRQPSLPANEQKLIQLECGSVFVTKQWIHRKRATDADWLKNICADDRLKSPDGIDVERWTINSLQRWLQRRVLAQQKAPPEEERARTLFQLQRFGVAAPKLLAFGRTQRSPWRRQSFVVTERMDDVVLLTEEAQRLLDWCGSHSPHWHHLIESAAICLRRIHDAGCALGTNSLCVFGRGTADERLGLASVDGMVVKHAIARRRRDADLRHVREQLQLTRRMLDWTRFMRAYNGVSGSFHAVRQYLDRRVPVE